MTARIGVRTERVRRLLSELGFTGAGMAGWREQASCRGADPELFYPAGSGPQVRDQIGAAKQVCAGCVVRELCLADAMAGEDPARRWGVVGGLSAGERAVLFAEHRDELRRAVA